MEYEARRQRIVSEQGNKLVQETRGWVDEEGKTVSQRSKEYAHDYRYFPEPDLPPLVIDQAWVDRVKARLPEMPEARRDRFVSQYGLPFYDANLLTEVKAIADYFEACLQPGGTSAARAKTVGNWIIGEFMRLMNASNIEIADSKVKPEQLCRLIDLVQAGNISGTSAKTVFEEMFNTGKTADDIIKQKGLARITDSREIEAVIEQVISGNQQAVADYRAGKSQAIKFLVGQVMKATKGRTNASQAQELLIKRIEGK
jgi:aspartyl-tRNA(Asn)/glutamyl-tRNA(Gln) amidotransferase subunit B